MADTLYTVPICATGFNVFTYSGNASGAMATYVNNVSAIIGGAVGANPISVFDLFDPLNQGTSDIVNFQPGRSYIVLGKGGTFNLGVSGTRIQAMPDKRYINAKTPGGTSSFINVVGFDDNLVSTKLSAAFARGFNEGGGVYVYTNNDSTSRQNWKEWNTAFQNIIDNPNTSAAQRNAILNSPNVHISVLPLSTYYVRSYLNGPTTLSAQRINNYLLSDNKDFQNDNIFITTDDGKYIKL